MQEQHIKNIVKLIYSFLIAKNYKELIKRDYKKLFNEEGIEDILTTYGGQITMPPIDHLKKYYLYEKSSDEKIVQHDIWINNEESDLTITLTLYSDDKDRIKYSLENLRVL